MFPNRTTKISYVLIAAGVLAGKLYSNKLTTDFIRAEKRLAQDRAKRNQELKHLGQ